MRTAYRNMFDADLLAAGFFDLGETATIQTQSNVPVIPHTDNGGMIVDDNGQINTASLMLIVRLTGLTTTPAQGGKVVYKQRDYRIADIQRHQGDKAITLLLQAIGE